MHACYHAVMAQLTVRIDDELAKHVKEHAAALGHSVNGWVTAVLSAAVDPELEGSEVERTRSRLARAGLIARPQGGSARRPDPARVAQARKAAGKGTPLSRLVSDGRA
jgi:plasmid stability protein